MYLTSTFTIVKKKFKTTNKRTMKMSKLKKHVAAGEYMSNTKQERQKIIVIIVIIMIEKLKKNNYKKMSR